MPLTVTADDRTGAMEAAALCADAGLTTVVVSWDGVTGAAESVVTDLRSRHLSPERAAARMRAGLVRPVEPRVHKIDSTLRGNWAAEVGALVAHGHRVLLVPAYPAAGRTCVGGVVRVDGVPVAETGFGHDPTAPVTTSRPAEAVDAMAAGAGGRHSHDIDVIELASLADVERWLCSPGAAVAVADAETDADIDALVQRALSGGAGSGVVLAGTAVVVGAVARRLAADTSAAARPPLDVPGGPVLVVSGSRHPASRAQTVAIAGQPGVTVIEPPGDLDAAPEIVALELAVRAHDHLAAHGPALVVLLGGDTADAFIGDRAVTVHGSLGIGMALGTVEVDGRSVTILTKPGGFGAPDALVTLLERRNTSRSPSP